MINRQQRKRQNTHMVIMHAAKKMLEERGIGNVTVDEISALADVSRSTFFTHFASLDDLLTEIANVELSDLIETAGNTENESGKSIVKSFFSRLIADTYLYPQLMIELLVKSMLNTRYKNESFQRVINHLGDAVDKDKAKSGPYTRDETVSVLIGGYFGLIMNKMMKNEAFDDEEKTKQTIYKIIDNIMLGGSYE